MYHTVLIAEIFLLVTFGKKSVIPASQEKWVREKGTARYLHTAIFQGSQIWTHKIFDWFYCSRHMRNFVFRTSWCSLR